jgi:hypothetical protein
MKSVLAIITVSLFSVFYNVSETSQFNLSSQNSKHTIGEQFGGGVIFYVDNSGQHGLIAAPSDQKKTKWYNGNFVTTNATDASIGAGQENTATIVMAQGNGDYAASICDKLELNGFKDWFLPSKDELNLLREKKAIVGGFDGTFYWCSTEYNSHYAWAQNFNNGFQNYGNKNSAPSVRAIRAF